MLICYDFSDFHVAKVIYKLHLCKKISAVFKTNSVFLLLFSILDTSFLLYNVRLCAGKTYFL